VGSLGSRTPLVVFLICASEGSGSVRNASTTSFQKLEAV